MCSFDTIDHGHLRACIKQRVNDGGILRLIGTWLKAGVLEAGTLTYPDKGTPQGGVATPPTKLQTFFEGVAKMLMPYQTSCPNSYRLMKSPITRSWMRSVFEKQIVRRTNRLIRVRRLMCLLSIFCVLALPASCCSASRCRS